MYKYRYEGVSRMGNKVFYTLTLLNEKTFICVYLKDLKPLLEANEVTNAIFRGGKVVEVPDVTLALRSLIAALRENGYIGVKVIKYKGNRNYLKIYNHQKQDITRPVWEVLSRYTSLTEQNVLVVSGSGTNMIEATINAVNAEALKCGGSPILNSLYEEIR